MIELYGSPASSSGRTHWMLEEVGVPYRYTHIDTRTGQNRSEDYLRVYPCGKVPALRDGDVVLVESMAINFYLAEKYKPDLMPGDVLERARVYQWSFWALTNLQPDVLSIMFDAMRAPELRKPDLAEAARARVASLLAFLEQSLHGHAYLVGDRFTVGDVNAGSVVNIARVLGLLAGLPSTSVWMERLAARPAFERAAAAAAAPRD